MRRLCGHVAALSSTSSIHDREQWIRVCCAAVLYCPSHLMSPFIIHRLFEYAIACNVSGNVILQQKSCKLICLLLRASKFLHPLLHAKMCNVMCHHADRMRSAAFAWIQRSEEVIPEGCLTRGVHGLLLLFKRVLKRREVHFISGASAAFSALTLLSLRGKPELAALGYVCGTLVAHGMLFSTLPASDSAASGRSANDDMASFLRILLSQTGLDSRNWKCRRTATGMLMALLHKLHPSIDEPILFEQSKSDMLGQSALHALIFAMTGAFPPSKTMFLCGALSLCTDFP
jgi:hypothetical protein